MFRIDAPVEEGRLFERGRLKEGGVYWKKSVQKGAFIQGGRLKEGSVYSKHYDIQLIFCKNYILAATCIYTFWKTDTLDTLDSIIILLGYKLDQKKLQKQTLLFLVVLFFKNKLRSLKMVLLLFRKDQHNQRTHQHMPKTIQACEICKCKQMLKNPIAHAKINITRVK